jgi:enediyne polyketide synthase
VAGEADLPFLRFLERPRVWVPGVELVAEAELSAASDPYLLDHVFGGETIFPAVLGLEAMAQGVRAVTGKLPSSFEHVRFLRPLTLPAEKPLLLRLSVLARGADQVLVVLRAAETGFAVNHFEATCRTAPPSQERRAETGETQGHPVSLDAQRDLYGGLFFQTGRFQRVVRYRRLAARSCTAEILAKDVPWFGPYLPATLLLGDPGARDAAIHAIQACIPHRTILPLGVERIDILRPGTRPALVVARERSQEGPRFRYDVEIRGEDGIPCERWTGLDLQAVEDNDRALQRPGPLLGPYLERRLADLFPGMSLSVVVENGDGDRDARRGRALERALGNGARLERRSDGKPVLPGDHAVSVSHADPLTVLAVSATPVGCDVERRTSAGGAPLDAAGRELARVIARAAGEDEGVAALRVWTALESLKKAGLAPGTPLVFSRTEGDGWVLLGAGRAAAATWAGLAGDEGLVVGFLVTPPRS